MNFRVTQEALSNVARHAEADHVIVRLQPTTEDLIELAVIDDGVGFDATRSQELVRQGHFGLAGMRERVQAANGTWELRTTPGHGTEVRTLIDPQREGAPVGVKVLETTA